MTPVELCQAEKEKMESNCWEVCKDLRVRVNDGFASARGYIHCCASEREIGCSSLIQHFYNHSRTKRTIGESCIEICNRSCLLS